MLVTKKNRLAAPTRSPKGIGAALVALPLLDSMIPALQRPARNLAAASAPSSSRSASAPATGPPKPGRRGLRVHADSEAARTRTRNRSPWSPSFAIRSTDTPSQSPPGSAAASRNGPSPKTSTPAPPSIRSWRKQIGQDTVFPSLELATEDFTGYIGGCDPAYACAYMNTLSWRTPTEPLPMEINPRVVFERMFGRPGTAAQRLARMQTDKSILDSLKDDVRISNPDSARATAAV